MNPENKIPEDSSNLDFDINAEVNNPVLKRLIEEVRNEIKNSTVAYNRVHNRHNRSPRTNTISK